MIALVNYAKVVHIESFNWNETMKLSKFFSILSIRKYKNLE